MALQALDLTQPYRIPTLATGASAAVFSNRRRYPALLRFAPSNLMTVRSFFLLFFSCCFFLSFFFSFYCFFSLLRFFSAFFSFCFSAFFSFSSASPVPHPALPHPHPRYGGFCLRVFEPQPLSCIAAFRSFQPYDCEIKDNIIEREII